MSGKEDLRVKRTKKALTKAFMKLLSVKSFEDITVNELCDEAGIVIWQDFMLSCHSYPITDALKTCIIMSNGLEVSFFTPYKVKGLFKKTINIGETFLAELKEKVLD